MSGAAPGRAAAPGDGAGSGVPGASPSPPRPHAAVRALRLLVRLPILAWSRLISPGLPPRCKYHPSCSRYADEAIREYGILRGLVLAGWRVLRCNPWSHGGVDPVSAQTLFRPR